MNIRQSVSMTLEESVIVASGRAIHPHCDQNNGHLLVGHLSMVILCQSQAVLDGAPGMAIVSILRYDRARRRGPRVRRAEPIDVVSSGSGEDETLSGFQSIRGFAPLGRRSGDRRRQSYITERDRDREPADWAGAANFGARDAQTVIGAMDQQSRKVRAETHQVEWKCDFSHRDSHR